VRDAARGVMARVSCPLARNAEPIYSTEPPNCIHCLSCACPTRKINSLLLILLSCPSTCWAIPS